MNKGIKRVTAVLGAVALAGAITACKQCGSHHGDLSGKIKGHVAASLDKIDATEEQRGKINAGVDQVVADGQQLHKGNQGLANKVVACLLLDTPDRAWLHATVDEKAKEFTGFAHRTVDRLVEISAVLTPGQRAQLKKRYEAAHEEGK
ncbi:hypothetical protein FO488_06065 [Geobacter sp. FeAm09]|uniref:Spy/CpxP family protein refolding chaperone n=1 Tax=Geobacter sp. FeAm09 TaxID=2597769 RepID=UPI0011EE4C89|nr:hypothetical protein [Geobacter sp. FeAm09]QEM67761.1 hypothetical protein FO488_06065 [Geobacter sp. FeAm09]